MYRTYEDPCKLEDQLAKKKAELEKAMNDPNSSDDLIADLSIDVHELTDRVRFAWDDDAECGGLTYEELMFLENECMD